MDEAPRVMPGEQGDHGQPLSLFDPGGTWETRGRLLEECRCSVDFSNDSAAISESVPEFPPVGRRPPHVGAVKAVRLALLLKKLGFRVGFTARAD